MVKLTLDKSPCDFKTTLFTFRNTFFFKKSGLELITGLKKKEIIDVVVDTIFDRMFNQDTFCFRGSFLSLYKKTSLTSKECLDTSSIVEYLLVYTLSVLDMAGANLHLNPVEYIQSSTGWFPPLDSDSNFLCSVLASLRSPGIVSIDGRLKGPSKALVNCILTQHLTQDDREIHSGFATIIGDDPLKIIWQ